MATLGKKRLNKELLKARSSSEEYTTEARVEGARRLTLLIPQIKNSLPPGISLVEAENLEEWLLDIEVLDQNPLYLNQMFRLKFRFGDKYPIGARSLARVGSRSDDNDTKEKTISLN